MSRRGAVLQDYGGSFVPMNYDDHYKALQLTQQEREFNAQLKDKKERESEADKYRKLKMIDDATDTSKYQSSAQKANSLATQQLLALRNEYAGKTNLPPEQLYLELQQKLTPVAQGYGSYKQALDEQEALAKKAAEVNPNLDVQKILSDLQTEFDNDYLTTNPDGTTSFNQAKIGTKSDALDRILRPENAWKYSKGSKGLMDVLKKGGEKGELFSQAPDKTQINYTTNVPFWAQVVDEKGQPLQADPATGLIPQGKQPRVALKGTVQDYEEVDDKGRKVTKQMVVVPQKTMDAILYNDELKYQFEGDWQRHKREAGIVVDPAREDDLKRIYFSQVLADNGIVQPYVSSRTHLPPQPRTNIRVSTGGKGDETQIRDVFDEINRKYEGGTSKFGADYKIPLNELSATAQGIAIKYANELTKADPPYGQADIFITKGSDGNFNIMSVESGRLIAPMDFTDINIKAQPGVKEKREVIEQGKKQEVKPEPKKDWSKYKRN